MNVKAGFQSARQQVRFIREAWRIQRRHRMQTLETVMELKRKYEAPLTGHVRVWDLLARMAAVMDPSDTSLYGVNQQTHVLQVLEAMERDGVGEHDMLVAALVHDIGKLLLLEREEPENVTCMNAPIGEYSRGAGLDNCVLQWNHDEFAYSRLNGNVPDHIAWLIRYHSIDVDRCEPLMDERDREYATCYLRPFQKYDQGSKSAFRLPAKTLTDYRELIETLFPKPILY